MNSVDGSVYPFSTRLIVRMLKPVDGVAAMALGKGAYAIHQSDKWYMNNPASMSPMSGLWKPQLRF